MPATTLSRKAPPRHSTAEEMAGQQREISVSEFFTKNRHLLGFDNPRKALLTTVKEAVDNAPDACEEAGILPHIEVSITRVAERKNGNGTPPADPALPLFEGAPEVAAKTVADAASNAPSPVTPAALRMARRERNTSLGVISEEGILDLNDDMFFSYKA